MCLTSQYMSVFLLVLSTMLWSVVMLNVRGNPRTGRGAEMNQCWQVGSTCSQGDGRVVPRMSFRLDDGFILLLVFLASSFVLSPCLVCFCNRPRTDVVEEVDLVSEFHVRRAKQSVDGVGIDRHV